MITFTVRSDAELRAKPAVVTARQLAAFRAFARQHGQLVDVYDDDDFGYLAYGFEARVCPWSWATIAGLFGDSDIGGILSGIFGGGRAEGGPVLPNKLYRVNERGPELF